MTSILQMRKLRFQAAQVVERARQGDGPAWGLCPPGPEIQHRSEFCEAISTARIALELLICTREE